ncbi:MAG: hypothetical protein FWE39_07515 [Nocardiaceae bacterium]|nr:hypothetical protein [Nocardiaceae bacterium]
MSTKKAPDRVVDSLNRVDELMLYVSHDGTTHNASLGGVRTGDLLARGLLTAPEAAALVDVAHAVDAGDRICDDVRLLDAWLTVFEWITSVRVDQLEDLQPPPPDIVD